MDLLFPEHVVAFTGHRPNKFLDSHHGVAFKGPVKEHLRVVLRELKPTLCITGMALGVDTWAAEVCIEDKIPYIAAVPFLGQDSKWLPGDRDLYREILHRAAKVHVVCEGGYANYKFLKRNEWMVDHCQTLVAVWDGTPGGTGSCVRYAQKQMKTRRDLGVIRLDPSASYARTMLSAA